MSALCRRGTKSLAMDDGIRELGTRRDERTTIQATSHGNALSALHVDDLTEVSRVRIRERVSGGRGRRGWAAVGRRGDLEACTGASDFVRSRRELGFMMLLCSVVVDHEVQAFGAHAHDSRNRVSLAGSCCLGVGLGGRDGVVMDVGRSCRSRGWVGGEVCAVRVRRHLVADPAQCLGLLAGHDQGLHPARRRLHRPFHAQAEGRLTCRSPS